MRFQFVGDIFKFAIKLGHLVLEIAHRFSDTDAGDDILTLSINQVVALKLWLACGGVTGHGHTSR